MTALWPHGHTALERRDDIASGEVAARSAPQLGTRARDLGSWPESGERVTTLSVFRESCAVYYSNGGTGPCVCGRVAAMMHFRAHVHPSDLERWRRLGWPPTEKVLARIEAEVRDGSIL